MAASILPRSLPTVPRQHIVHITPGIASRLYRVSISQFAGRQHIAHGGIAHDHVAHGQVQFTVRTCRSPHMEVVSHRLLVSPPPHRMSHPRSRLTCRTSSHRVLTWQIIAQAASALPLKPPVPPPISSRISFLVAPHVADRNKTCNYQLEECEESIVGVVGGGGNLQYRT